jgi:hypothetical protein
VWVQNFQKVIAKASIKNIEKVWQKIGTKDDKVEGGPSPKRSLIGRTLP